MNSDDNREKFIPEIKAKFSEKGKSWGVLSTTVKETTREVLEFTSGKCGKKEDMWWWCEEVQSAIKRNSKKRKSVT